MIAGTKKLHTVIMDSVPTKGSRETDKPLTDLQFHLNFTTRYKEKTSPLETKKLMFHQRKIPYLFKGK